MVYVLSLSLVKQHKQALVEIITIKTIIIDTIIEALSHYCPPFHLSTLLQSSLRLLGQR